MLFNELILIHGGSDKICKFKKHNFHMLYLSNDFFLNIIITWSLSE